MVVQEVGGRQLKYICCMGTCPNPPSTAPAPRKTTSGNWTEMLIDIVADPYDMADLAPSNRAVVDKLRPLLPLAYAAGCAGLAPN